MSNRLKIDSPKINVEPNKWKK